MQKQAWQDKINKQAVNLLIYHSSIIRYLQMYSYNLQMCWFYLKIG